MNSADTIPRATTLLLAGTLGLSFGACTPSSTDSDTGATDSSPVVPDTRRGNLRGACPSAVVPSQFGFRWKQVNHRVSKWGVGLVDPPAGACHPGSVQTTVVGGTFSTGGTEKPRLKFAFQRRNADDARELGFSRRSIDVTIGPSGTAEGRMTFDRQALGLEGYPRVVAFIDGFDFDTDVPQPDSYPDEYDPAHGYTLRNLGVSVAVDSSSDRALTLSYQLELTPGLSPDRELVNRAIPHARIGGRLDVLLAGTYAPTQRGTAAYSASYPKPRTNGDDDFDPPPIARRTVTLAGQPGAPRGIYGLSSFRIGLRARIDCSTDEDCPAGETCRADGSCSRNRGRPGFYVREVTVDVQMKSYEQKRGRAAFVLTGFASNSTKFVGFWPMTTEFQGTFRWIQAPGGTETRRGSRSFETGTERFGLDDFVE